MTAKYSIRKDVSDSGATIQQNDRLDTDEAKKLYMEITELLTDGCRDFTLNAYDLSFCDSRTLGAWVMIYRAVSEASGSFELEIAKDSQVHSAIEASHLDQIFSVKAF